MHISETLLHCNMNPSSHSLICFLSDSWMPPWSPSPERISRKRLFYLCTSVWPGPVAAFVAPTLQREVEEEETVRKVERDSLRKIREKTSSLFFLNTASLALRPSLRPSIWPSLIGWLFGSCMNEEWSILTFHISNSSRRQCQQAWLRSPNYLLLFIAL